MVNRQYKCPVCGAPLEGDRCEYCGCVIYDFAAISTNEPRYIKLQIGDRTVLTKAIAVNPCVEISTDTVDMTGENGKLYLFTSSRHGTITLQLECIEDEGKLFKMLVDKKYKASWEDDIIK